LDIVIEEADESAFWLEVLQESDESEIHHKESIRLHSEIIEIVKILARARKNTKK